MDKINGVTCIKGEVHNIMTLLRLNTRWAAPARFSGELLIQNESPLIRSFRRLNERLEGIYDLRSVDCVSYLHPFHQVIVSEHASGPLTSTALSSLSKFVLYGFLSPHFLRAREGINLIASAIPQCRFEETDWESDEVIFMKLLELSALCLQCDSSQLLKVSVAWDIFNTCSSIHSQYRASKLLKSEAETALRHITLTTFSLAGDALSSPILSRLDRLDSNRSTREIGISSDDSLLEVKDPGGTTLLLGKIMHSLSENIDPKNKPSSDNVKFFLSLINVALEAGGPSLGYMEYLVEVLRGDVCRHLLILSQSEDLAVFSLALRVVFNLFVSIKDHMKVQLEVFLTSVHLRILNHSSSSSVVFLANKGSSSGSAGVIGSGAREELALESLLEFCREPSLMHDIYTNYDCDMQCTNLFDSIVTTLCARATPSQAAAVSAAPTTSLLPSDGSTAALPVVRSESSGAIKFVNILNRLALEGVLIILHAVAVRCGYMQQRSQQGNRPPSTAPCDASNSFVSRVATGGSQSPTRDESFRSMNVMSPPVLPKTVSEVDLWCMKNSDDDDDSSVSNAIAVAVDPSMNGVTDCDPLSSKFGSPPESSGGVRGSNRGAGFVIPQPVSRSITSDSLTTSNGDDDEDSEFMLLARARTAEVLRQRKLKKQRIRLVTEKFNEKPLSADWIRFAADLSLLPAIPMGAESSGGGVGAGLCPAKDIAVFLKTTAGLGKAQVGEFLSRGPADKYPFHAEVLHEYVNTFSFSPSATFVEALRTILGQFRLPGEAQCIDRLLDAFSGRIFQFLGQGKPFASAGCVFILLFSTIMLNTDLHNKNMKKKMTLEEFIRNNRGINEGDDLPRDFLENLYHEIKTKEIELDHAVGDDAPNDFTDHAQWKKMLRRGQADQAPASFTPTLAARLGAVVADDSSSLGAFAMFPPSAHEKDMFQVMAKQVLDVVLDVWHRTDDDILLFRILAGLSDYAMVCWSLDMGDYLNSMVQMIACFSIGSLEKYGSSPESETVDDSQMRRLLNIDFDSLVKYGVMWRHGIVEGPHSGDRAGVEPNIIDNESEDDTPWRGLRHMRGHVLLLLLFHIFKKYGASLGKGSWIAVAKVLLWARSKRVLPDELTELDDFSNPRGGALPLSVYAVQCEQRMLEDEARRQAANDLMASSREQSIWESVASLGGLLWAPGGATPPSSSSSKYSSGLQQTSTAYGLANMTKRSLHMLEQCMVKSGIENLLFAWTKDIPNDGLGDVVWSLLAEVVGSKPHVFSYLYAMEGRYSGRHKSRLASFFGYAGSNVSDIVGSPGTAHILEKSYPQEKRKASEIVEIDAVTVLEWVSRIVFVNRKRSSDIWPIVHDFLQYVLESNVDDMCACCPFLVERSVVAVVSAAIHLMREPTIDHPNAPAAVAGPGVVAKSSSCGLPSSESNGCAGSSVHSPPSSGHGNTPSAALWTSLRLLREVPHELMANISDRLGAGLVTYIRGSPGIASIVKLDQWFLVFSLLTTTASSTRGAPYVWEIICFLIDNNLINNMNFTPCRHLVIQFMNRATSTVSSSRDNHAMNKTLPARRNPWLDGCLFHLMRLTLMAVGGYASEMQRRHGADTVFATPPPPKACNGSGNSTEQSSMSTAEIVKPITQVASTGVKYMKFPLPVVDAGVIYSSTVASSPGCGVAANAIERGKDSQPCTTVVTVVCIDFHHIEDVVKLWLDNVKIFSDFASSEPAEVSKNATFCLKAILFAGQLTALPSSVWMEAMTEMLNRLPLNLDKAVKEFQLHGSTIQLPTDKAPRQLSGKDHARLMEMCLRCTAVVFDCMVYHFKALRNFENFQTLWLKYVTTLAQNAHFAASSSDMKGESVDMIGSLLRLLHHPPVSDTGITHAKETAGSIAVVSADNKKPANSSGEGEHKAVSDETLMLVSWRAAKAGCPSLVALLQHNHPLIVQTILTLENKQNTEKGDIGGEENGAGRMPSTNGDQRSFYSRLFEFKSQIV